MNLLQLQKGSKQYGQKILFESASFSVNQGEHIGVIGPNGAGKTTLFKILTGQETLDSGILTTSNQLRIGYLEQEAEWDLDKTSLETLSEKCIKPIWELKKLGQELGLQQIHFDSPLQKLSGGYRMRMKLLYLIGMEPNLMLLDEPTNFLDLESLLTLENFLQGYEGAFLLISHDREFLLRTTEATLEVEGGDITKFPGHIDDYFEQKAQLQEILAAKAQNLENKRKSIQEFVDRFKAKATKAKQAQSRMKMLDRMGTIETKKLPVRARIKIPTPIPTGKAVITLKQADLGYGENTILKNVSLQLERGDHLGIVGVNGAGKSTLLKSLSGQIELLKGERTIGYQVKLSHFSQHSTEQLNLNDTVLSSLEKAAHFDTPTQEILGIAGSLLFSGDDVHKKVSVLSGGEKSRVALGQVLLQRSPLLLLDEPTNHLDFDTVEALTMALVEYPGTVIAVSHDRSFIGRLATKILEIRNHKVEVYPGTYNEYVWSQQKGVLSQRSSSEPATSGSNLSASKGSPDAAAKTSSAAMSGSNESGQSFEKSKKPIPSSKQKANDLRELRKKMQKVEAAVKAHQDKLNSLTDQISKAQGASIVGLSRDLALVTELLQSQETVLLEMMIQVEELET